jgi:DNA-nicking Smr family endonuclease
VKRNEEKQRVAEAERRVFREAVSDVRPLAVPPKVRATRPKPHPRASFRRRDSAAVLLESLELTAADLDVELPDELRFRRPGIQESVLRKLRRGQYRVSAECDLHGLTVPEAKQTLREFLARCIAQQERCVRVIHGKGLRSGPRGPVIKSAVNVVLRRTAAVLAFCSARPVDGGTGAIYVLLQS